MKTFRSIGLTMPLTAERILAVDHVGLAHAIASQFLENPRLRVRDSEQFGEACLELVLATADYDSSMGPYEAYVWRRMRNALIDSKRFSKRKKRHVKFEPAELDAHPCTESSLPADMTFLLGEFLSDSSEDTDQDKSDKKLVQDVYLNGRAVPDIAAELGVSRPTVYNRMNRWIAKIRERHAATIETYRDEVA